jgi:hypothetical protein
MNNSKSNKPPIGFRRFVNENQQNEKFKIFKVEIIFVNPPGFSQAAPEVKLKLFLLGFIYFLRKLILF